ncbi:trypsin-like serine protease [Xylariaceae sp. FL1651]|nr:trypsin-like serine protease [Xylariaceae sp. FL1651]
MSLSKFAGMAGMWSMDLISSAPPAESSFGLETTQESVFDPDHRSLADENDYKDGGKYRSIVKLQMRYEKQKPEETGYAMGTGWLIAPDLLVTAGHNVFNWAHGEEGLGRAVHIKCYIGYHGRDSINSPIVQCRSAKKVVTTAEWLTSKDNRHRDVAFIQVDRAFEGNLRVFSYKATPKAGDEMIGVVGYPADKSITDSDGREEKGAMMYELFNDVQYNLEDKKNNALQMLKYRISTFGGQSGAPVIRKNAAQVAIATHVYGGGDKNQASCIGKYGNDYDALISVLTKQHQVVSTYQGISLVKTPSATSSGSAALQMSPFQATGKAPEFSQGGFQPVEKPFKAEDAEGFWDVLKTVGGVVANVGKTALPFVSPLLGPAGGPVSAVAGAALGAMAKACAESAMDGMESHPSSTEQAAKGSTERAILAEASLQAVLQMDHTPLSQKILDDMQNTYTNLAPNVKYIAPKLAPGLLSSAYKITVDKNYVQKNKVERRTLSAMPLKGDWSESSFESNDFVNCMMQPTRPLEGEEGFFGDFGNVLSAAFQVGKPLLHAGAKYGLTLLNKTLAESSFDAESSLGNHDAQAAELVAKRAIMGEAALQAVMKLKKSELDRLQLVSASGDVQEEGFIDFVKTAAQKIGSVVKETAPSVIKAVLPLVVDALAKPGSQNKKPAQALSTPTLRTKRSVLSLVNNGSLKAAA